MCVIAVYIKNDKWPQISGSGGIQNGEGQKRKQTRHHRVEVSRCVKVKMSGGCQGKYELNG